MTHSGGCLCGAIRFEAVGEPTVVLHCHCDRCRRFSGAAFLTGILFSSGSVSWATEKPALYPSSPDVDRGFCPRCGSSLTFQRPGRIYVLVGSLDDPDSIDMSEARTCEANHVFAAEKISWIHVDDDLPQFDRYPT